LVTKEAADMVWPDGTALTLIMADDTASGTIAAELVDEIEMEIHRKTGTNARTGIDRANETHD
jgi:hypothetical protein